MRSRFTVELPHGGGEVTYGFDATLGGYRAEVRRPGRRLVEYDLLHPIECKFQRPLEGLCFLLVKHGVFTEEELHDALLHLEHPAEGRLSRGTQLAVAIVATLKSATAD